MNSEEYIRENYTNAPNLDALILNGKKNLDSLKESIPTGSRN
jgi:hypothetical protein